MLGTNVSGVIHNQENGRADGTLHGRADGTLQGLCVPGSIQKLIPCIFNGKKFLPALSQGLHPTPCFILALDTTYLKTISKDAASTLYRSYLPFFPYPNVMETQFVSNSLHFFSRSIFLINLFVLRSVFYPPPHPPSYCSTSHTSSPPCLHLDAPTLHLT